MEEKIDKPNRLEGTNIYLKLVEEHHIDEYFDKISNSSYESMRFTGSNMVITKSGLTNYVKRIVDDPLRLDYLIISKSTNEVVGEVVLNEMNVTNRSANTRIAIYQVSDFNKKYGTEALQLIVDYGFSVYNLHRIELQVYDFNERAIHVYEKLGFKKEGVLRDYLYFEDQYHDAIVMSMLESEYHHKNT